MSNRRYFNDDEIGRLFFTDGEEPDGVFVEEITAREFFLRSSIKLACGWPENHWPNEVGICPCGRIFPDMATIPHNEPMNDDEALQ